MKVVYGLLFVLHGFVGFGALAGGLAAITNPEEPLGVPIEILKNSPFENFLIPGVILFTIIGLGNIFSSLMMCFKSKYQGYISSFFSWALVIWIIVQCLMINDVAALHVIFFTIGLIEASLSTMILYNKRLFPVNLIFNAYNKIKKEYNDTAL
jgi:hypothetical protein